MTWTRGPAATTLQPLGAAGMTAFRRTIDDSPQRSDLHGVLNGGGARVFVAGAPGAYRAALIDNPWDPDEPTAVGADARAIWSLLSRYRGWTCVGGLERSVAEELAEIFRRELSVEPSFKAAITFVLREPAVPHESPLVRHLRPGDDSMVDRAPPEILGPFGTGAALLAGCTVAAGIVDGELVGWMSSGGWTAKHAGIGGHVLEPWRNQGIGSASAFLVAREAQRAGRVPTWSTGEDNPRSQHVARKLGFQECGRDWYVIVPAYWSQGGFVPRTPDRPSTSPDPEG